MAKPRRNMQRTGTTRLHRTRHLPMGQGRQAAGVATGTQRARLGTMAATQGPHMMEDMVQVQNPQLIASPLTQVSLSTYRTVLGAPACAASNSRLLAQPF